MATMTKKELIRSIANDLDISVTLCDKVLEQFSMQIAAELFVNDECPLPGVGKLVVKHRSARTGRNPQTGKKLQIPSSKTIALKPSKPMREFINGQRLFHVEPNPDLSCHHTFTIGRTAEGMS